MRVRFDSFYSYAELTETLEAWAAAFPTLCSLESIGSSYEGRDIWLVTVTNLDTGPATRKTRAARRGANSRSGAHGDDGGPPPRRAPPPRARNRRARHACARHAHVLRRPPAEPGRRRGRRWQASGSASSVRPYPRVDAADGHHEGDVDGDGRILLMRIRDRERRLDPTPRRATPARGPGTRRGGRRVLPRAARRDDPKLRRRDDPESPHRSRASISIATGPGAGSPRTSSSAPATSRPPSRRHARWCRRSPTARTSARTSPTTR